MEFKFVFFLGLILLCILLFFEVGFLGGSEESPYRLYQGKNIVEFNITNFFYVETLIKLNPEIEVVSYIQEGKSMGYVNFLHGIGENFIVENNVYEIITRKDTILVLP